MNRRRYWILAFALGATVLGGGAVSASTGAGPSGANLGLDSALSSLQEGVDDLAERLGVEDTVAPGTIDDGKELLPQARISLEEANSIATAFRPGDLGEVDLEYYEDRLVFNVEVGDADVKVDALDGSVLGAVSDD